MSQASQEGFRLSPQQRRAWSSAQEDASSLARWTALLVDGPLDPARLRQASSRLAAAHEILRTTFHRRTGIRVPFQVVQERAEPGWRDVQLSDALRADPLAAAAELARQEEDSAFNLEKGPVFRLSLAQLSRTRHVLLVGAPALSADRRTLQLVAAGLAELYAADGAPDDPAIQYADFSQWQNELLEADDDATGAAREYWAGMTSAAGSAPFGGLAGAFDAGPFSPVFDAAVLEKVDRFCAGEGVARPDFFLACWQTALARTTGEAEVVTEEVHAGRKLEDLREALGPFAKALPTLFRFDGNAPFSEAVKNAAEARRSNDEWEEYYGRPEDLEAATAARSRRTGFEWVETAAPSAGEITMSVLRESPPAGGWPLWLECIQEGGSLRLTCGADATPAAREAASRLARHLDVLVRAAAGNPRALAAELPLLGEEERRKVLADWNRTAAPFSHSATVHELFEGQAARTPDAPAVVCGTARLSYAELDSRADALARTLIARGVRPGVRVGLALDRSVEVFVAMMAILKAGGAYVPLNPEHPDSRLAIQLAQCEAPLVVTSSAWVEKFAGFPGEKILMDGPEPAASAPGPLPLSSTERVPVRGHARAGADDPVYVMYTSGSTGVPKGVAIRHRSLVNYAEFVVRLLGADRPLSFATVSTISADLGNTAIFPSLLSGGCLHVIDYETAMEGGRLAAYMAGNQIDVLKVVPSHLAALLAAGGAGVLPRGTLVLGGEALSWDLVERIRAAGATCRIVNHYGPTEATVGCLTYAVSGPALPSSRTVPVGRPIANAQAFVLDPAMSPVPVGVAGELYVGGAGIAAEYVNQPAETSQKFVASPFSGSGGDRLYRTGDRVRHHPSGDIEFLGRVDDQVKIRGFRIEPGEAQAALTGHPAVAESFVAVREDSPGERRLVAYVIARRGSAAPAEELRAWLRARLPDYMIPSAFVSLNSLPLTPNGKVDRQALPAPEQAGSGREYVAPATPAEETVARIWAEVLRIERVGSNDNFFELGGHSLLVTQVVSRMRKAFARDLPIRWVFESPTVAELAARTAEAENADVSSILDELEGLPDEPDGQEVGHEPPVRA